VAAGKENAAFRYRTFPKSATQLTAKELLNLAPKIDIPNAKPIKQRTPSIKITKIDFFTIQKSKQQSTPEN
jgi:hypothetical protein